MLVESSLGDQLWFGSTSNATNEPTFSLTHCAFSSIGIIFPAGEEAYFKKVNEREANAKATARNTTKANEDFNMAKAAMG